MTGTSSATPLSEKERLQQVLTVIHSTLTVLLIALRPLVWDGDVSSPANLVYLALILLALLITVGEIAGGLRTAVRWSVTGLLFAALVIVVIPAALNAPIPATGSAFIWQLALHLGLGAYLMQTIPGRESLAWSALVAGLGAEVAIGWVQGLYVLPKMLTDHQSAAAIIAEGTEPDDFAERIANGGWFGTFTLSNSLAAWLLLTVVPVLGIAWRVGLARCVASPLTWILALGGSGLLVATRSKGALIALAAAAGGWWLLRQRGWLRWLPMLLIGLAVGLVVMRPAWSSGLTASAQVRWGYWSGAVALVREAPLTGLGIGSFAERSSGVMPLWAEPSRMVHNEPLELAVVAGIPAALLLVLVLLLVCWPRRVDADQWADHDSRFGAKTPWLAPITLALITAYLALLGMLDGNLGWWPGGASMLGQGAWGVLVGGGLALCLLWSLRSPLPARWWLRLALAALALHTLIDFDLHSFAIIGTLITVAVLAGGTHRESPVPRWVGAVGLIGVLVFSTSWIWWANRAMDLRYADNLVRAMRLIRDPAHIEEGFASVAAQLGVEPPAIGDRRGCSELLAQAVATGLAWSAADPTLTTTFISVLPPSIERLARLDEMALRLPYSLAVTRLRAQDYLAAKQFPEAVNEMRRGIAIAPAYLPMRQELETLCEQLITHDPANAERWHKEQADSARQRESLASIVNYRNRSR